MSITLNGPLVLIGAGKMGGAMLSGWLARGLDPRQVFVQDPGPPPEVAALLKQHNIEVHATLPASMPEPAVLLIAVKPQVMEDVFPPVARRAGPSTVVLSIAAGRTIASFAKHLPKTTAIIRSIPNTPAAVGRGITVCCPNPHVTASQRILATELLSAIGQVGWVEDEALIDTATAVSGSGQLTCSCWPSAWLMLALRRASMRSLHANSQMQPFQDPASCCDLAAKIRRSCAGTSHRPTARPLQPSRF